MRITLTIIRLSKPSLRSSAGRGHFGRDAVCAKKANFTAAKPANFRTRASCGETFPLSIQWQTEQEDGAVAVKNKITKQRRRVVFSGDKSPPESSDKAP